MKLGKTIFLTILFCLQIANAKVIFNTGYPSYQKANFIFSDLNGNSPFKSENICLTIRRHHSDIGAIRCRGGSDLVKDSTFQNYLKWLDQNIEPPIQPQLLKARDPKAVKKLKSFIDDYFIFVSIKEPYAYFLVFQGESNQPKALFQFKSSSPDLSDQLASALLSQKSERIPSQKERAETQAAPNQYYSDRIALDYHFGYSFGFNSATYFGTPRDWAKETSAEVTRFNRSSDTVSAWNWLDDQAYLQSIRAGLTYAQMIGAEFHFTWSKHDVKFSPQDSLHQSINDWYYDRYEFGIRGFIGSSYQPYTMVEFQPRLILGFHYSFLRETFDQNNSPDESEDRFQFDTVYKGALAGVGLKTILWENYAIKTETGISGRGRSIDQEPTKSNEAKPAIMGGSTIDYYFTVGVEYQIREWLD